MKILNITFLDNLLIIGLTGISAILLLILVFNFIRTQKNRRTIKALSSTIKDSDEEINRHKKNEERLNKKLAYKELEFEHYKAKIAEQYQEKDSLIKQLSAQKTEVDLRNEEIEQYAKELEKKTIELASLNRQLIDQKIEVDQRNEEIEAYLIKLKEQSKEQEALNQQLFAQKIEVEQRKFETELYSKNLEEKTKELEKANLQLFTQGT